MLKDKIVTPNLTRYLPNRDDSFPLYLKPYIWVCVGLPQSEQLRNSLEAMKKTADILFSTRNDNLLHER